MAKKKIPNFHVWVHVNYTGRTFLSKMDTIQSSQINPVVTTFKENIAKVFRLSVFPVMAYVAGKRFQMAETAAFLSVTSKPFPDTSSQEVPEKVVEERDAMLEGRIQSPLPSDFRNPSETEQATAYGEYGTEVVVDLLMPMQIVVAWTVFETLLNDLLHEVAAMKGTVLHYYSARFTGKQSVQEVYTQIFQDNSIDNHLNNPCLLGLYAIRNLMVHRAGICDAKYKDWANKLPRIPQLALGQKLELTGQKIHNALIQSLTCCISLIKEVDLWLVKNP